MSLKEKMLRCSPNCLLGTICWLSGDQEGFGNEAGFWMFLKESILPSFPADNKQDMHNLTVCRVEQLPAWAQGEMGQNASAGFGRSAQQLSSSSLRDFADSWTQAELNSELMDCPYISTKQLPSGPTQLSHSQRGGTSSSFLSGDRLLPPETPRRCAR